MHEGKTTTTQSGGWTEQDADGRREFGLGGGGSCGNETSQILSPFPALIHLCGCMQICATHITGAGPSAQPEPSPVASAQMLPYTKEAANMPMGYSRCHTAAAALPSGELRWIGLITLHWVCYLIGSKSRKLYHESSAAIFIVIYAITLTKTDIPVYMFVLPK